jgi:hypothetical protein
MAVPQNSVRTDKEILVIICLGVSLLLTACGGGGVSVTTAPSPGAAAKANHVVLIVLENTNYSSVVASPDAPYLNSLIPQGAQAVNYYADVHPSIGNYFMLTSGQIVTIDDSYTGTVTAPDLATEEVGAGKSWKVYAEGIPSVGYTGGDTGAYLKRHNPFAYFADVAGSPEASNIVPFSQLATDASTTLPNLTMIVGNIFDVGHNCVPTVVTCTTSVRVQQADAWLQATLPQILSNVGFQNSGLLAVTFDESENDLTNGGGRVLTLLLGTNVKHGYQATGTYQHQSLLRLLLEAQGVNSLPNASALAPDMGEVWK